MQNNLDDQMPKGQANVVNNLIQKFLEEVVDPTLHLQKITCLVEWGTQTQKFCWVHSVDATPACIVRLVIKLQTPGSTSDK